MQHPKSIAYGEIGLDYHDFGSKYNYAKPDLQKTIFIQQIADALNLNKPMVIHTREAEKDTLLMMKERIPQNWKIHVHCFTDSWDLANELMSYYPQLYIGFTGVITFKNSNEIRNVVKNVPLNRLLVETDGPFMAPVPYRGGTAHPGHIPTIVKKNSRN